MKKTFLVLILLVTLLFNIRPVQAVTLAPWNNHAAPLTFLFGNHIDMHQQSAKTATGHLGGFLYVYDTGEKYRGLPIMEHTDCNMNPGCVAGWTFVGAPAVGKVVGFDSAGMATWCTVQPAQPGYSHFHWLNGPDMDSNMEMKVGDTYTGYTLKLVAVNTFYFRHHGTTVLVRPGFDTRSHANIVSTCP